MSDRYCGYIVFEVSEQHNEFTADPGGNAGVEDRQHYFHWDGGGIFYAEVHYVFMVSAVGSVSGFDPDDHFVDDHASGAGQDGNFGNPRFTIDFSGRRNHSRDPRVGGTGVERVSLFRSLL